MNIPQTTRFRLALDPTNPGQFLACCGLFECAYRLWGHGVYACFSSGAREFCIEVPPAAPKASLAVLVHSVTACVVGNTMTVAELRRFEELGGMKKKDLENSGLDSEKKRLESLRREAPVVLSDPLSLTIDWHLDSRGGGSIFKTWAGQQSILDIAQGMQGDLRGAVSDCMPDGELLQVSSHGGGLPFNFDSDLGGQGAALDVGFSFDPLAEIQVRVRPAIELFAFVGVQRFRPKRIGPENRFLYSAWSEPLPIAVAQAAACSVVRFPADRSFEFRLLYRTKYLKSFLPAKQLRGDS